MKRMSSPADDASRKVSNLLTSLALFALLLGAPPRSLPLNPSAAQTPDAPAGEVTAVIEDIPELHRTVFNTPHGTLYLNLPKNIAAGGAGSGTLFAEPAGRTADERKKNSDVLKRYAVEVSGKRVEANGKPFQTPIQPTVKPAVRDATNVVIIVKDMNGKLINNIVVAPPDDPPPPPKEFSLPRYGQAGGFLSIRGPFDGEVAGSDYVSVGGKRALTLAESATSKVVLNDSDAAGLTRLEVKEQGRVVGGEYRNITLKMSATKYNLLKGEQSTLRVEVGGLEDLREDIPLRLENRTTAVLTLGGGDTQALTIRPADVRPGGLYTTERALTGIRPGPFYINGVVIWGRPAGGSADGPTAATRQPARFFGLPFAAAGRATLDGDGGGGLRVSNLGPGGEDGLTVALGESDGLEIEGAVDVRQLPDGTRLTLTTVGKRDGLAGQTVGVLRETVSLSRMAVSVEADFSMLGATSYTARALKGDEVVAEVRGLAAGVAGYAPRRRKRKKCRNRTCMNPDHQIAISFPEGLNEVTLGGGPPVLADELVITAEGVRSQVEFISSERLQVAGPPEFTITAAGLYKFGALNTALGVASLDAAGGGLTVANLGDSGKDGVSVGLGRAESVHLDFRPPEEKGAAAAGAFIEADAHGAFAPRSGRALGQLRHNSPLGLLRVTKRAEGSFEITADFSAVNSPTQRVQVVRDGVLVADIPNHKGPVGMASAWPAGLGKLFQDMGRTKCFSGTWPAGTKFVIGGKTYSGDELRVLAEDSGGEVGHIADFGLRAARVPGLTITKVRATPARTGTGAGGCGRAARC